MQPINVLSLFDGMSCGRLALADAGIPVAQYHASEVDKFAIQVTTANWPDTVQMGSVTNVTVTQWYDLLIGGSPCQSFSFAGKRKGMATKDEQEILTLPHYLQLKADGYEFEGQSYLFWEYVRILAECRSVNPNIKFMLENVVMAEKWERVITQTLGVKPIKINSALVSAQNRERLYWTNIGLQPSGLFGFEESIITQPADRGILLKDILQTNVPEKYYLSDKMLSWLNTRNGKYSDFKVNPDKTGTLNTKNNSPQLSTDSGTTFISDNIIVDDMVPGTINNNTFTPKLGGKSLCLDANYHKGHDNHGARTVIQVNPAAPLFNIYDNGHNSAAGRVYNTEGKAVALSATTGGSGAVTGLYLELNERQQANYKTGEEKANTFLSTAYKGSQANGMTLVGTTRIRRLTPTECERLQTVPDGYTAHVSDTQRYKMLGNGWTIKVISHLFGYLKPQLLTTP